MTSISRIILQDCRKVPKTNKMHTIFSFLTYIGLSCLLNREERFYIIAGGKD